MEEYEVTYVGAEDHTDRGYNASMNFWYVGGELVFSSETMTLPAEVSFLEMEVKSPVMDPVDVRVRLYPEGREEVLLEAGAASTEGNTLRVDLREFAGETVRWEVVYAWEQSSLITVQPEFPVSRIVSGAAESEMMTESGAAEESAAAGDGASETGTAVAAAESGPAVVLPASESGFRADSYAVSARDGILPFFRPEFYRNRDFGMFGIAFTIIVLSACLLLRARYDMKREEERKEMEAAWREKKEREKEEERKRAGEDAGAAPEAGKKVGETGTAKENVREEWRGEFEKYEKRERKKRL